MREGEEKARREDPIWKSCDNKISTIMNLITKNAGISCLAMLFLFSSLSLHAQTKTKPKPNVIIILTDDVGYGDVSCYGGKDIYTPNIDYLASHGVHFTNGHAAASTCTPSRYSILAGQYAFRNKQAHILPGSAPLIISTERMTLGKIFQRAGYRTAAIGKWHLGLGPAPGGADWNGVIKPGPVEVGFDYSFIIPATPDRVPCVYVENHHVYHLDPKDPITVSYEHPVGYLPTGDKYPRLLWMKTSPGQGHLGTIINGISRIGWMSGGKSAWWVDSTISDVMTGKVVDFIKENRHHPFFIYFACHDVHVPRVPDHRFVGKSGMGPRGDELLEMDWCVGRVREALKKYHLTDNTLIVFSSDNGPVLNDGYQDGAVEGAAHPKVAAGISDLSHERFGEAVPPHNPAGPFSGGKYSMLEGGTRVPFIVYWPGVTKPAVSDALVCQVDLLSSFAHLLGEKLVDDEGPDSYNLLNTFLGKSKTGRKMLVEQGPTLALVEGDWKYIEPHEGPALLKSVNIASGLSMEPQLYDLRTDSAERINLASKYPERIKEMAAALKKIKTEEISRPK